MIPRSGFALRRLAQPAISSAIILHSPLVRLSSSLAVLEQKDGKLNPNALRVVTAARQLKGSVTGFLAGGDIQTLVKEAAKIQGIEKIVVVENAAYDKGLPETFASLLVENIKKGGYSHVFAGHTAFGKSLMPRVAALLDVAQISDITSIIDESKFVRPIYAGNAISTVESLDKLKIITIRGVAFAPADYGEGYASVEDGVDPKMKFSTEWVSENLSKTDRPNLTSAERIVSGGRGLRSKEDFNRIMLPLADALGAAVGASRAAVDSGFADNSLQVGQTGKVVAPQLYLCTGISGAIQHLSGMKDSKVIAAINKDPDAPIFQVADVGLVGDLFERVPELTEKLKQQSI
ncbi:hypothetical protein Golomagni_00028 [Golovinomyces magnicellulatus]|nr:hypothetical protein Golomagni_00028 [Golovinomyces magnicellulatus]